MTQLINIIDRFIDFFYDFYCGIETRKNIELNQLNISSPDKINGRPYQGTRLRVFKKIMGKFSPFLPLENSIFLDVGCGKGRVLFMAKSWGFEQIWGIDFSPQLICDCKKNLGQFAKKQKNLNKRNRQKIKPILASASQFSSWNQVDIVYMYNPFDGNVLKKVMQSWEQQLATNKELYVIYVNPLRSYLFDLHPGAELLSSVRSWNSNNEALLYRFRSSSKFMIESSLE